MDWLEANVLSKSQEQLSLQWPQKQRRSHVARGNPACQLALAEQRPAEGTEGRQDRRNPEHPPGAHSLAGELTVRCGPEGWLAWECGRISGEGELASSRVTQGGSRTYAGSYRWVDFGHVREPNAITVLIEGKQPLVFPFFSLTPP